MSFQEYFTMKMTPYINSTFNMPIHIFGYANDLFYNEVAKP